MGCARKNLLAAASCQVGIGSFRSCLSPAAIMGARLRLALETSLFSESARLTDCRSSGSPVTDVSVYL